MRPYLLGLALLGCLAVVSAVDPLRLEHEQHIQAAKAEPLTQFTAWATKHAKPYLKHEEEFSQRFKAWMANLEYIIEYNAQPGRSHWLGLNHLADLTHEEYKAKLGFNYAKYKASNRLLSSFKYENVDEGALPTAIDWRAKGAVTEVKNQGQCGSCWAFSTTGSVEGANAIATGTLVSLSEQELVDCDKEQDNGCHGGLMDYAYEFIVKNGGLDTEEDYPYTAEEGECEKSKKNRRVVSIDGHEDVPPNNEMSLKKAVAHQPVSVAIEADQKSFQLYAGGVYNADDCGTELDHGVLVVGYGRDSKAGMYWIVKNSWGPEWGDKGYIRIKAMTNHKEGMCGIAMAASYPTKTGPNPDPTPTPGPGPKPGPKPKPPPSPTTKCDETSECPAGSTCCCVSDLFGLCLAWGCCPIPEAVCCDDHEHCCPSDLPLCDTAAGRCLPKQGSIEGSIPWYTKSPAIDTGFWGRFWPRRAARGPQ